MRHCFVVSIVHFLYPMQLVWLEHIQEHLAHLLTVALYRLSHSNMKQNKLEFQEYMKDDDPAWLMLMMPSTTLSRHDLGVNSKITRQQ